MSNYTMNPVNPSHHIMIGWDAPMNSYFLHVVDTSKDEDDSGRDVLWIGCSPHEIYNPDVVLHKAEPYASVDEGLRRKLMLDSERPEKPESEVA